MNSGTSGFTLIEMSIVLVVIGLVVGGVLVGQDLIRAAALRAQISQIEKYNTAVNTFYGKYQALPGDMNARVSQANGFAAVTGAAGCGDGNGAIEGYNSGSVQTSWQQPGEPTMFWIDLTTANGQNVNLMEGGFSQSNANCNGGAPLGSAATGVALNYWFPSAKIGGGNYVYVFSIGGVNYFGISVVSQLRANIYSSTGLTVNQANSVDAKIDDGLPQNGRVLAYYVDDNTFHTSGNGWATSGWAAGGAIGPSPGASAAPSATTCYDNGGNASNPMQYSLSQNNGNGVNCALSFKMQGGD
jgi:prepilin-type N-terminal cleavage/methylation domain-containing protein